MSEDKEKENKFDVDKGLNLAFGVPIAISGILNLIFWSIMGFGLLGVVHVVAWQEFTERGSIFNYASYIVALVDGGVILFLIGAMGKRVWKVIPVALVIVLLVVAVMNITVVIPVAGALALVYLIIVGIAKASTKDGENDSNEGGD